MIFYKDPRLFSGERTIFLTNVLGKNWICACQRMKLNPYLTQSGSRLNVRHKTINLLEQNMRQNLHGTGFGNDFLDVTPKAQAIKEKNR